jgi:hypothetical protein
MSPAIFPASGRRLLAEAAAVLDVSAGPDDQARRPSSHGWFLFPRGRSKNSVANNKHDS